MTTPRSKTQQGVAVLLWLVTVPLVYVAIREAMDAKPNAPRVAPAVAKAIGDFETAKAIKDKSRGCFYAGVVVATMISARDTAGAQRWRAEERHVCEYGF